MNVHNWLPDRNSLLRDRATSERYTEMKSHFSYTRGFYNLNVGTSSFLDDDRAANYPRIQFYGLYAILLCY